MRGHRPYTLNSLQHQQMTRVCCKPMPPAREQKVQAEPASPLLEGPLSQEGKGPNGMQAKKYHKRGSELDPPRNSQPHNPPASPSLSSQAEILLSEPCTRSHPRLSQFTPKKLHLAARKEKEHCENTHQRDPGRQALTLHPPPNASFSSLFHLPLAFLIFNQRYNWHVPVCLGRVEEKF